MTLNESRNSGFTLVEVLVALALISIVFALASSGWLAMSAGQKRVQSGIELLAEGAARQTIFSTSVARTLPWLDRENTANELVFAGQDNSLDLIVARPSYETGSAYQLWRWRIEPAVRGYVLQVQVLPFHSDTELADTEPDDVGDDPLTFFSFETEPRFAYLSQVNGAMRWRPEWPDTAKLPTAIALMRTDGPSWIVPLRHRLPAICTGDGAQDIDICI